MMRRFHSSCGGHAAIAVWLFLWLFLSGFALSPSCADCGAGLPPARAKAGETPTPSSEAGETPTPQMTRREQAAVTPVFSQTTTARRSHDQLWLVSCRSAGYLRRDDVLADLTYAVYQPATGWAVADQAQFERAGSPSLTTCLLILGNGYTAADTRSRGHTIYQRLTAGVPVDSGVRFVIWSWPSDHIDAGPIKDLRAKASRTTNVAWCLARWIDEVPSAQRLSVLGTSFGARIVMEALELRGDGELGNVSLESPSRASCDKANVVLISAAIDSDWLLPGGRLAGAVAQTHRLLLVNNTSDSVLKRYHWLYGARSKVSAVGSTGLRRAVAGEIEQIDAAPIIGRRHGCAPYFESSRLLAEMRAVLFDGDALSPPFPAQGLQIPVANKAADSLPRE